MSYDERRFASAIDSILRSSDLNTISAKRIRKALSAEVGYDVNEHKEAINKLIEQRFDKIHDEASAAAKKETNGHATNATSEPSASASPSATSSPEKRGSKRAADDSDMSDVNDSPKPPRKQRVKASAEDEDAAFAARLQAEENSRARPTRGGATKKKAPVKKQKRVKVKSSAKVKENGDPESGTDAEPQRKGGFHKPMALSEPLAELLGETQLSRPQTVKKIWEYVKARDLQDPADKRQIRCDDAMRAVFKTDRVHMFTMNKILNQNLYAVEEIVPDVMG